MGHTGSPLLHIPGDGLVVVHCHCWSHAQTACPWTQTGIWTDVNWVGGLTQYWNCCFWILVRRIAHSTHQAFYFLLSPNPMHPSADISPPCHHYSLLLSLGIPVHRAQPVF